MSLTPTKADGLWLGIVLLGLGACGFLDVAGVLDANHTIGLWWPLAIIGWPVTAMLLARRVTLGATIVVGLGLALLADAQQWTVRPIVWSALFSFVGAAILVSLSRGAHKEQRPVPSSNDDDGAASARC
jgi:hypothetical protein